MVSAWRALTALRIGRATSASTSSARSPSSGASSTRKPSLCVYSVSCRWRTEISSATSTRSTTERRWGMSRNERKSPFWRSKSTTQTGRPGAARTAASASCSADGGGADAALGAGDGDQLAAERAGGRLLARDAVAHRARPLGGGAHAALELLERERERDDVAQPGVHRGAQQLGRVVGGDQHEADLREARGDVARDLEHRHRAERVVQDDDVDLEPAQRARGLLGVRDPVDHLQPLALLGECRRALGELGVGDREEQAVLGHRSSGRV